MKLQRILPVIILLTLFTLHAMADDTWPFLQKYMIKKGDGSIVENEAVMWIGDLSKPVKGIILTSMTRNEYEFTHDPTIRQMAKEEGIAIIFMYSERQQDYFMGGSMGIFDPSLGHDTVLVKMLKGFAEMAEKPEIEHAPWLTFGHSTAGLFARYIAWWKPERMFGVILYKSGGYVPPEFVENPDTATFLNIPWLSIAARNDKFGPGQDGWRNMRRDMMPWREIGGLMSEIVEPTMEEGHSLWRPFNAPYIAMWIRKAAERKIPADSIAADRPVQLAHIENSSGVLSDTAIARLIDEEELSENLLRFHYDAENEDIGKMFWHFDDEMAITWVNYHHKNFEEFNPQKDTTLSGRIKYWRSDRNMSTIQDTPGKQVIVTGMSPENNYAENYSVETSAKGEYEIISYDRKIKITRDLPGSYSSPENAQSPLHSLNGYDAMLLKQIAEESTEYEPELPDIFAADVNLDGLVDNNDFVQFVDRAILKIPEFRQNWNYQGNQMPVLTEPSLDFVFFDSSKTRFNLEAKISKTYPDDDGRGFSRHRLPDISDIVISPYEIGNPYPSYHNALIFGLMLGDLDGSNAGLKDEIAEDHSLGFSIGSMLSYGADLVKIPVYLSSEDIFSVRSIDLEISFKESAFDLVDVESEQTDNIYGNFIENELYVISFSNEGYNPEKPVAWISSSIPDLNGNDIEYIKGYINGYECTAKIISLNNQDISCPKMYLYPNPVQDELKVELNSYDRDYSWEIFDLSGRKILESDVRTIYSSDHIIINTRYLDEGIYVLKMQVEDRSLQELFIKN